MGEITTIGLDLAKNIFQVHGIDETGTAVLIKRLRRSQVVAFFAGLPPCLVGMEACATAHHWARELTRLGHEVRLMTPQYVKAYVKRNKNDAADAAAICEAVKRPSMRFVPAKTIEQQSALLMHRARDLLIRQRTMLVNALRGHMAEFGLIEAQGLHKVAGLIEAGPRCEHLQRRDCPHRAIRYQRTAANNINRKTANAAVSLKSDQQYATGAWQYNCCQHNANRHRSPET